MAPSRMAFACLAIIAGAAMLAHAQDEHPIYELHGSGTTNPSKYFWKVMDMMEEQAKVPLFMTYRAVGSSTGQKEFVGTAENGFESLNHFGAGDIPMTQARYDQATQGGKEVVHVPFLLGPIAVFHSVPSGELPTVGIQLDACLLSKIFSREIKTWDDPAIMAQNPTLNVPANTNIKVVHRTLGSSSTSGLTEYLATATKDNTDTTCVWLESNTGSTVEWNDDETFGVFGSGGMAEFLADNDYAIGYLDAGHGHSLNLEEIALQNKDGRYLKSTDADISATAAVALTENRIPATSTASFADVNLYDLPGTNSWPITLMSYFYIRKDLTGLGASGPLLKAFVEYVLSPTAQNMLPEFLFSKLPQQLLDMNAATLAALQLDPTAPTWDIEGSSTRPYDGAATYVLSEKRKSYAEVERDQLTRTITALQEQVVVLQTELVTVRERVVSNGSSSDDNVAIAALIVALFALFFGAVAVYKAFTSAPGGSGCAAAAPCAKPEVLATQYHVRLDEERGAASI
mmetsp:Transcript_27620/g.60359  ORF Transcript_27620/g.60359 Transcript_27620/m.60359 type:complete len:515 (-) Transcript_27620:249-1793(-)